jgi:localization factor PodJL
MKLGVPWSVKGIRPEARETAREAARRSGMSLGDWLNSVILQQAAAAGTQPDTDDDEDFYGEDLTSVHQRLDDLTRKIDHFARTGPQAYAPKQVRDENEQLANLIARLDRRIDQFVSTARAMPQMAPPMAPAMAPYVPQPSMQPPMPAVQMPPSLDRAVAEISARQRALNGAPAQTQPVMRQPVPPPAQPAPLPMMLQPVPTQDLSGLEDQLRRITDQIETLRKPGVEEAINALRGELGEIGRALNDAMPRRAIDTIEKQIQGLTQRLAEGRQAGVDSGAIAGVEHGLAEVRDALRGLTPAESLVGFNEAVHGLAHKIDLIVAQKDPATLSQLEHAITTLRDMAQHVASNEAVGELASQVHMLSQRVEHLSASGPGGDALNHLEHRIEALSRALAERAQNGGAVPPRLEALVQSLTDKIEQIQQRRGDNVAVDHLEDRIVQLVERLDASDSRLGHLETIERGLADLLVHIEDIRSNKQSDALRTDSSPAVDALKQDLARTQNVLEAVNGTLGHVVDRLAMIEKDIRGEKRSGPAFASDTLELTQPVVGKVAVRMVEDAPPTAPRMPHAPQLEMQPPPVQVARPQPAPQPAAPQPAQRRMPPVAHAPIDPDLPPDQPLEPGSGPPRLRPGARIAASEAALGPARPAAGAPAGSKSSFIAAARRAAQAAVEEAASHLPRSAPAEPQDDENPSGRGKLMKRMKSLFVAASIVAGVVGTVQILGNMVFRPVATVSKDIKKSDADATRSEPFTTTEEDSAASDAPAANPLATPKQFDRVPPPTAPAAPGAPSLGSAPFNMNQNMPSLLAPPTLNPPASNDVTGSITRPSRNQAAPRPPETGQAIYHDRLPIAIGGARLRNAAAAGDAAAAYEIATRFAEGRGVPANLDEAARWYERAASKGLAPAQFRYASLLEKGQGVKKDLGQARKLYLAAAAKGNAKAMHNLAVLYAEGIDGRPDYATAAQWFTKAAQHGVPDSQYNLGVLAARGLGMQKNLFDSYKWFSLAAAQGDKEAARKRDEVAGQLDARALAAAQQAISGFVPEKQPQDAIAVQAPQGGWDNGSGTPAQGKLRSATPLSLGALNAGKR